MKSTGVVRKVDELGRIVIPIELRRVMNIKEKDSLEIFVEEDEIILKKYEPYMACAITGEVSRENQVFANGKVVLSPQGIEMLLKEIEETDNNIGFDLIRNKSLLEITSSL
ncbi:AbrB/MazE/SpoVT family DNA-binding domain-containing protein [Metabacillus fastidiosus]|uniref:AbrB/MazE/SpoVT family DNA-binding domain-containing protein n=1 Tax=Metabacillus fastidiosus TaxID=1458 RepID=UPI003D2BB5FC